MYKKSKKTAFKNLLYLILLALLLFFLISIIVPGIALFILGFDVQKFNLLFNNPESLTHYRWLYLLTQGFNNLLSFGLAPLIVLYAVEKKRLGFWFVKKEKSQLNLILGLLCILISIPLISSLAEWNEAIVLPKNLELYFRELNDKIENVYEYIINITNLSDFLLTFLVIAVIPAISEEILFRGSLQGYLCKIINVHVAIFITSLIFASLHLQIYLLLPRLFLGILLGYVFLYTSNLLIPMIMHFLFNGLTLTLIYFFKIDLSETSFSEEHIVSGIESFLPYLCLFLLISIFIILRKNNLEEAQEL